MEVGQVVQIQKDCWQVSSRYREWIGVMVGMEDDSVAKVRLVDMSSGHFYQYVSIKFLDVVE